MKILATWTKKDTRGGSRTKRIGLEWGKLGFSRAFSRSPFGIMLVNAFLARFKKPLACSFAMLTKPPAAIVTELGVVDKKQNAVDLCWS